MVFEVNNDAEDFQDQFAAHQQLMRERLHHFLKETHSLLCVDVIRALAEPGKLLFQQPTEVSPGSTSLPAGSWALLSLFTTQHVSPDIKLAYARDVGIAVECFICALDLLDDIEDEDQTPITYDLSPARLLNVSTFLLSLTQHIIISLAQEGMDPSLVLRLLDTFRKAAFMATAGQHRDLLAEQRSALDFTQEECIEIASWKAGALMQLTCLIGAQCAEADDELCTLFSELGMLLGIAHQLDNDCHDLYYLLQDHASGMLSTSTTSTRKSVKTDLVRRKKTLPVVLAAKAEADIQGLSLLTNEERKNLSLHTLHEEIIASWGICLLYRTRAHEYLQRIEALKPITTQLKRLLGFK